MTLFKVCRIIEKKICSISEFTANGYDTMNQRPQAILFDMDGVLVDSLDAWRISLNRALKTFHHNEISREEFIEQYWGHDLYDNLDRMGLSHEIGTVCNTIYNDQVAMIKLYPKTKETLDNLATFKKGLITNTPKTSTVHILKQFDLDRYFDVVVTSDDVTKSKPNPEIVLKACRHLGVTPEHAVLVGDTKSDVKAGKAAGCIVVGMNIKADYTITELSQLLDIVKQ